jgi:lipoic acid synthetase
MLKDNNSLPPWFRTKLPSGEGYQRLKAVLKEQDLPTVCNSAICPNRGECWSRGVATFLIMGDICTRSCKFCNVKTGRPDPLDEKEPVKVAKAIRALGLRHVVITSVDRDDLPDGGASFFALVVEETRKMNPNCTIEVLVPDFKGSEEAADKVIEAAPDIFGHNIETVPSLYPLARRGSLYQRSLGVLRHTAGSGKGIRVKTGLMVGLGEGRGELLITMREISETGCGILTVGQYLRPSPKHLVVNRFYEPEEFDELREEAIALGFTHVMAGPLVRSSYLADLQVSDLPAGDLSQAGRLLQ